MRLYSSRDVKKYKNEIEACCGQQFHVLKPRADLNTVKKPMAHLLFLFLLLFLIFLLDFSFIFLNVISLITYSFSHSILFASFTLSNHSILKSFLPFLVFQNPFLHLFLFQIPAFDKFPKPLAPLPFQNSLPCLNF